MKKMALYVLFENKNTFLFLFFNCLLLNLQMCQIILPDPVYISQNLQEKDQCKSARASVCVCIGESTLTCTNVVLCVHMGI